MRLVFGGHNPLDEHPVAVGLFARPPDHENVNEKQGPGELVPCFHKGLDHFLTHRDKAQQPLGGRAAENLVLQT